MNEITAKRKRVTIKDIAKKLNISPSTVSRALNDHPRISSETKRKVKEIAEELGYFASGIARTLKTKRSMTVGIIVSDIKNPFFLDFLDGVERTLFPRKYKMLLATSNEDADKEETYLRWLLEHNVDGIIVSPTCKGDGKNNLNLLRRIKKAGIPVVLYDRVFEGFESEFDSVTIDNAGAILDAMKYLYTLGHKRIGIILASNNLYTITKRYQGYLEACNLFRLDCRNKDVLVLESPLSEEMDIQVENFIKKASFTAVIATNHDITKKIYKSVRNIGVKIPEDLSVIGFDDVEENLFFDPPVTVIRQPVFQIGKAAAMLILSRLDGEDLKPHRVVLNAELVKRRSVSAIRGNSQPNSL